MAAGAGRYGIYGHAHCGARGARESQVRFPCPCSIAVCLLAHGCLAVFFLALLQDVLRHKTVLLESRELLCGDGQLSVRLARPHDATNTFAGLLCDELRSFGMALFYFFSL